MCLAIPGKLVRWIDRTSPFSTAAVEFGGVNLEVNMACVPEAEIGDYVLVHAGIAISIVDRDEAERLLRMVEALDALEEEEGPLP